MPDMPHYCSACGEVHGGQTGKNPEIEIEKIRAEKEIRIAELARSETREIVEGATEQTEIASAAAVEGSVVKAEVLEELAQPEPEPEPVVIVSDETENGPAPEPEAEAEPPGPGPAPEATRSGSPWW